MIPQSRDLDANLGPGGPGLRPLAPSLWRDVQLIVGPYRPHTLLVGPAHATTSVIDELRADFIPPVWVHDCATATELPHDARTIILRNLDALDVRAQHALMARLDAARGRLQIVSAAERSPFVLVQRGVFLEELYRRLSLVYLWLETPT